MYLVTAVVASELATRARRRAAEAEQRERESALLADAAAALLQEAPLDEIRERAEQVLARRASRSAFRGGRAALLAVADEREQREGIRRSDAIKTVILHTVSHDFRTPLATMRAAVDGLQSTGPRADRGGPRRASRDDRARGGAADPARRERARSVAAAGGRRRATDRALGGGRPARQAVSEVAPTDRVRLVASTACRWSPSMRCRSSACSSTCSTTRSSSRSPTSSARAARDGAGVLVDVLDAGGASTRARASASAWRSRAGSRRRTA